MITGEIDDVSVSVGGSFELEGIDIERDEPKKESILG